MEGKPRRRVWWVTLIAAAVLFAAAAGLSLWLGLFDTTDGLPATASGEEWVEPPPTKQTRGEADQVTEPGPPLPADRPCFRTPCQIDRSSLDVALRNPAGLARVAPHYRNGKQRGVRLTGLSDTTRRLGFEEGDLLLIVNGAPLDSPSKALSLYEALKHKARLTVVVERRGQLTSLRYVIR